MLYNNTKQKVCINVIDTLPPNTNCVLNVFFFTQKQQQHRDLRLPSHWLILASMVAKIKVCISCIFVQYKESLIFFIYMLFVIVNI